MLAFCGQDRCQIDANGRVKLSPRVINDFIEKCGGEVVMHCLPEGALAVYPESIYLEMRRQEEAPAARAASSMVFRRELRRFGALSSADRITAQGRLTIPHGFRDHAGLLPGVEIIVVGVEIGVELWSAERWNEELMKMNEHAVARGESEMADDLIIKN
jgi:DNA-binding transcriptional regulator/RsmH inhibitor MraZ